MRILITSIIAAILATTCGPEFHYQTLDADIGAYCQLVFDCESGPTDFTARCENDLHDQSDLALEEGSDCAEGFAALVNCISTLSCKENTAFANTHSSPHDDATYPCKSEDRQFLAHCNNTWYSVPQQEGN